jgi:ubiquinone/menaquinone biosynthesis C-methylase UbiE
MTHEMYALPNDSEQESAQEVMASLTDIRTKRFPQLREFYDTLVQGKSEPNSLAQVRALLLPTEQYHNLALLVEQTQDKLWQTAIASVDRQLPELIVRAMELSNRSQTLWLEPQLVVPDYLRRTDFHRMPGGYTHEERIHCVRAGAIYDRGVSLYARGGFGNLNDLLGVTLIKQFLKKRFPGLAPKKILDVGCGVGHATLPYVDEYPESTLYGIDASAPMLRYGHARAMSLGKELVFWQQNAECTGFEDDEFDLIVSHILLHELPLPAVQAVLTECYRLLAPGGLLAFLDARPYRQVGNFEALAPFTQFVADFDNDHNEEPFWRLVRSTDLRAFARKAGFKNPVDDLVETWTDNTEPVKHAGVTGIGSWYVLCATK